MFVWVSKKNFSIIYRDYCLLTGFAATSAVFTGNTATSLGIRQTPTSLVLAILTFLGRQKLPLLIHVFICIVIHIE